MKIILAAAAVALLSATTAVAQEKSYSLSYSDLADASDARAVKTRISVASYEACRSGTLPGRESCARGFRAEARQMVAGRNGYRR